ncbi:MAG: hypothetical protein N3E37_04535, partial [Candidatus Micrarchaeota archaeon]|nr:hypothetical protein [Candidatus Micrarchaeota archaeon]
MTKEEIEKAWKVNGDGAGVSFLKENKWNIIKGITKLETLIEIVNKYKDNDKVVHFRLASTGGVAPELTHPFESRRYILFHNGTWIEWYSYATIIKTLPILKKRWLKYNKEMNYEPKIISDTKILAFLLYL